MQRRFGQLIITLILVLIVSASFTFAYWNSFSGSSEQGNYDVEIADFPWDNDITVNFPDFIPDYIRDKIESWKGVKDPAIIHKIATKVVQIFEYTNFSDNLFIESVIDDFFEGGSNLAVSTGDYIMYTVGTGDDMEVIVIYIENGNHTFWNSGSLLDAIEAHWMGVLRVSPIWMRGTLYTRAHAAVEYDGRLYYWQEDRNRMDPPPIANALSPGTWFVVYDDLAYDPINNIYPLGHFTLHEGTYYRATQGPAWGSQHVSGWPWVAVQQWSPGTYSPGNSAARTAVYTIEDGKPRFWEPMQTTSLPPSEENCRATGANGNQPAHWREVDNAWIGLPGNFGTAKTYFKYHNTYNAGDIVVYGIAPNMQYRFYRATAFVPDGNPPLYRNDSGELVMDGRYWERWL